MNVTDHDHDKYIIADYNSKITKIEGKISSIRDLVQKTDYNTKKVKLEVKSMITIMINKLLLQNSI